MEFRILGPVEAVQDGHSVELGGPLEKALLARLLIDAGRTVSVERLIEDIWEGEAPGSANVSIRVRVSRLRKVLASAGSATTIETKAGGYSFVLAPKDNIDIDGFQTRHQAARVALVDADFRLALSQLELALTAWRGSPLTGMGEPPFAAAERTRLDEGRLAAIEDKIDAGLALGKHSAFITELEALVNEFPLREKIWAQLMTALYRAGRQADALAAFNRLREMLSDQLGIDPSPELAELETRILQQSPELSLHALPGVQDRAVDLPSGVVTFLFTDIEGSSEMWETHRVHMPQVLIRHDELIANAVSAARGSLIKSKGEGDATLSVFRKATDAAMAALDLALSIREESWPGGLEPRVRIAIHTGEAHERDGDYFGPSVNRAARVRSLAAGGQTLLSQVAAELVRDSLPDETSLVDLGERVLRGMTRAEHVFELTQRTGDSSVGEDSEQATRPPVPEALSISAGVFVGRGLELEHLSAVIKQSAEGELRVVFLAGEPGIGKTRFSAELAQRAFDGGAIVLYGRCDEEPLVPYQPFVEGLRGWVKSLSPAARSRVEGSDYLAPLITELSGHARPVPVEDPEVSRYKFFEAVASAFQRASETAPLLFVLDDLHWADRPTLQLLQHITRTRPRCSILLLGTYRETDLSRTRPLAAMLADFRRERVFERMALGGLVEEEIHELLQRSADHSIGDPGRELAKALRETTEGNPFFIEQIIGSLIDSGRLNLRDGRWFLESKVEDLGIPEGVIEAIGRRLSRLSDQCNKALAAASVLGRDFEVEVLTRVLGSDPEDVLASIEEGLQVGLIRELPGKAQASCTFSHALVQQALYEELSLARKQRLHLKAAQSIEDAHPNSIDSYVTTLARHLREAGAAADPEKAIDFSVRAMEATARVFAFEDGIAHGEAALELMEDNDQGGSRAARLHERLGDMRYVAGLEYERSFSHYEESLDRWAALNEDNRVARVHIKLGRGLATYPDVADINKAFEHLLAAKEILGSHPDPKLDGPLALGLAAASLWNADPVAGLEHAERAIEIGRERASDAVWATGTAFEAWALSMMGLFDQSTRKHDEAWETADRLDNVLTAFAAAWTKCNEYLRDPIEHSNLAVMEFEKPRQAQTTKTRESLRATAAGALVCAGQVPRAKEMMQGTVVSTFVGGPGIRYLTGSFDESERLHMDALAERDAQGLRWSSLAELVYILGPIQWANGNIAGARESFESAVTLCERGCIVEEFEARARLACLEALDGEASKAVEHVTRLDELQELGNEWRGFLGTAELARALTVFARETADAAEPLFVKAIDNYREFGLPFGEAEALFIWGRALSESDPGGASDKFSASLDLFTRYQAGKAWVDLLTAERDRVQ